MKQIPSLIFDETLNFICFIIVLRIFFKKLVFAYKNSKGYLKVFSPLYFVHLKFHDGLLYLMIMMMKTKCTFKN